MNLHAQISSMAHTHMYVAQKKNNNNKTNKKMSIDIVNQKICLCFLFLVNS